MSDQHTNNYALIMSMIEAAEKNLITAKSMLKEMAGGVDISVKHTAKPNILDAAASLNISEGGKVIEGMFDGQNMIGPDKKSYPVPVNYASKSKLVTGDILKLTISDDGTFIYKQIQPAERKKMIGILLQDEKGDFKVMADGKIYRVLYAALTYFKAQAGDNVTIIVPEGQEAEWAAVENVIHSRVGVPFSASEVEMVGASVGAKKAKKTDLRELDDEF